METYAWLRYKILNLLRDIELALHRRGMRWLSNSMMRPRWWIADHLLPYARDYQHKKRIEALMQTRHKPGVEELDEMPHA